ncbi:MAG: hypothetical protein VSS75_007320, partial [Candidatus Parabeggiatoa sp.]|nr:hypothetical protein [Candidatus Parabeggiatoa sp.]
WKIAFKIFLCTPYLEEGIVSIVETRCFASPRNRDASFRRDALRLLETKTRCRYAKLGISKK